MSIDDDIDYTQYGPQAHHLAALINRCAALTPPEVEGLARNWHPGDDEQRVIARMRARGLADGAARVADRDTKAAILQVDGVVRAAAPDIESTAAAAHAAKDALCALVARDLISAIESEWGHAEYDFLTGPCRQVIGPVHHGDACLS